MVKFLHLIAFSISLIMTYHYWMAASVFGALNWLFIVMVSLFVILEADRIPKNKSTKYRSAGKDFAKTVFKTGNFPAFIKYDEIMWTFVGVHESNFREYRSKVTYRSMNDNETLLEFYWHSEDNMLHKVKPLKEVK